MHHRVLAEPLDEHDRRLLALVRPPDWRNPEPAPLYDLVVIGAGTAGLVCAAGAAGLGARVALVERALLGGDCLNTGCVPSKALLRSARAVREAHVAARTGVTATAAADFGAVMSHLRARRADLAPPDAAERLTALGVDVFLGRASFSGRRTIDVHGGPSPDAGSGSAVGLRFRKAVIATGARPSVPPIPGLDGVPYLTSETLFSMAALPPELIVIGAGAVGCEMAQAFALLGSRVTLLDSGPRVLPHDDPDAAALLTLRLTQDGVRVRTGVAVTGAARVGERVTVTVDGATLSADALLVATGRVPNVEGLRLEAAGVATRREGIEVDDRLRTANPRIYAAGDSCSRHQFTHVADAMARLVIRNALFFGRARASALVIPWCTFTLPEVAHVGPPPAEAARLGAQAITIPLERVDRAVVEDEDEGFLRVHHRRGRIVAATVVAAHAGELIATITHVMQHGGRLGEFSSTVFPYPTLSLALRQAGDAYRRASLTPARQRLLQRYFRMLR